MSEIHREPINDRSAWRGAELDADRAWEFPLDDNAADELADALNQIRKQGLQTPQITAESFPLPRLGALMKDVCAELQSGRGFAVLRNFPVDAHSLEDLEAMYWGLCSHIGVGVTQNSDGGFIHYVTDGTLRPRQGRRGVGSPQETMLHVDLRDVASLLCVRQAPDDPPSRFASSTTVYNEILDRHPELLERLYAGYEWDRMDEHDASESPTSGYRVPLFSQSNGAVSCQYNRNWITNAVQRNGQSVSDEDNAIFDLIDAIAREACFEFPFHAGDVQFCNNYTVMHGRAGHQVVDEEAQKRLLMRIWLDVPGFRPFADEAIVRMGTGSHGRLGWTAADIASGRAQLPRARRPDGALVIDRP